MAREIYLKKIVRSTYDRQAQLYKKYSGIQKLNLENLMAHVEEWDITILPGLLLDAGCGIPDDSILQRKLFSNRISEYIGMDLSFNMLTASSSNIQAMKVGGDLEAIPFRDESFSVVSSNSVLHWLNFQEQNLNPQKGCKEIFRILKTRGAFILSVSGVGTARKFQKAFYEVSKSVPDSFFENELMLRRDPIGSMELHELVQILELAGFTVSHAVMEYEPFFYKQTDDYINHVKAYGEDVYLSAFVKQHRNTVWKMVSEKFKRVVGEYNYLHDQFMIYAVAIKK